MGEVLGGDKGPGGEVPPLAGHLRHRRGGNACL
ncbi:hypothetical protein LINGRAHAP2_LOCUS20428 [Linum grandiflorum]